MISFLDPVSVNPFLVEDRVKKVTMSLLFLHGLKQDDANFGHLVKKYIIISIDRFGGDY